MQILQWETKILQWFINRKWRFFCWKMNDDFILQGNSLAAFDDEVQFRYNRMILYFVKPDLYFCKTWFCKTWWFCIENRMILHWQTPIMLQMQVAGSRRRWSMARIMMHMRCENLLLATFLEVRVAGLIRNNLLVSGGRFLVWHLALWDHNGLGYGGAAAWWGWSVCAYGYR